MTTRLPTSRQGFTWIELLVVLAVVGVLAALLLGAAGKALNSRKAVREIANFRTIGMALHGYLAEHNQVMPTMNTSKRILAYHLGLIPSVSDWAKVRPGDPTYRLFLSQYDERPTPSLWDSYAKNLYMGDDTSGSVNREVDGILRYHEIVRPSRKLYFMSAHFLKTYHPTFSAGSTRSPFIDPPHYVDDKGPFPALFVDGHVETVDPDPSRVGSTAYQLRIKMIMPRR